MLMGNEQETQTGDKIFIFDGVALQDGLNEIKVVSNIDGVCLRDVAVFNKVSEANPSYLAPAAEGKGASVANWFDMPDVSDVDY